MNTIEFDMIQSIGIAVIFLIIGIKLGSSQIFKG
ncbi:hypothetical protein PSHO110982_07035 [Pseudostreptobacillus hongkongensis]